MASFSSRSSYSSGSPMRNSMLMSSQSDVSGLQVGGVGSGSVYGGAGGFGVRISQASFNRASSVNMSGSEKATMQNLNTRLASYLDKVGSLEKANAELELKIRRFLETKMLPEAHDFSAFQARILGLQKEIALAARGNSSIFLAIDNAKLAADDFKMKYENEMAMRQMVDADILGLKAVKDDLIKAKIALEKEIEDLNLELFKMKKQHEEDLLAIKSQLGGQVNVEVDAAPQQDLAAAMDEIRRYYEGVTEKNHKELEAWFLTKTTELNGDVSAKTLTIQSTKSEIIEIRRTVQSLEIELQSLLSMVESLRNNLADTKGRYSNILAGYQRQVLVLEEQLADLRASLTAQGGQYQELLDIKTRLELEITEYRRLLDGGL